MIKRLLLISILVISCTSTERTEETLHKAGFKDVKSTGYNWFSCGKGDIYTTDFEATNPSGNKVTGTVCCGLLKGCTIRF